MLLVFKALKDYQIIWILLFVTIYEFSFGPACFLYCPETMTLMGISIAFSLNFCFNTLIAVGGYFILANSITTTANGNYIFLAPAILCFLVIFVLFTFLDDIL